MGEHLPFVVLKSRRPADADGLLHVDASTCPLPSRVADGLPRSATHDISRTSFHVKHVGDFAQRLEDSAKRAFPNRGRTSQRYKKVQALLLHWHSDDLFVLPELEDLEKCLRQDFAFGTDIFAIPSENSHLELMMRVAQLVKEHESQDTLFLVYYGGHARIDESRQSTWCATRGTSSPWLQWSAIQTLLERSTSDALILLDCCAGAASATFPNGNSVTETISASSWDAIAPDPGRYSFTNALIEVLQEWRMRTFSAAMLHAEVLARLKHPRPININGKQFEARSTPVHFMMTANHKAPSIELSRLVSLEEGPGPARHHETGPTLLTGRATESGNDPISYDFVSEGPNEDTPHVMISLALEDDQQLDINAWERWLTAFPSMAKYVKVQGVFRSHSTLMLVSLPVMVWNLLPEDPAMSFVAFIRSNNLATQSKQMPQELTVPASSSCQRSMVTDSFDKRSVSSALSETNIAATEISSLNQHQQRHGKSSFSCGNNSRQNVTCVSSSGVLPLSQPGTAPETPVSRPAFSAMNYDRPVPSVPSPTACDTSRRQNTPTVPESGAMASGQMMMNQQQVMRHTILGDNVPEPKNFSPHVERRLEDYYQNNPTPSDAHNVFIASNLGIELNHLEVWFHYRKEKDLISSALASMKLKDAAPEASSYEPQMILPAELNRLLDICLPGLSLLFDVRSASEYERSHVYGAINLRAPKSFLEAASLDLIERVISNEQERKRFAHWKAAKCLAFYGRGLESSWECPAAELITQKLRAQGWTGHCFVLRGHYREFCQSFDKHIVAAKNTRLANAEIDSQATLLTGESDRAVMEDQYASWLEHVLWQYHIRPMSTSPTWTVERQECFQMQEKNLEAEFQARHGPLHKKAVDIQKSNQGHDKFDTRADMVGYLDRGLEKMRSSTQPSPLLSHVPSHIESAQEEMPDGHLGKTLEEQDVEDEYVEISQTKSRLLLPSSGVEQQHHT
ncbi:hypothetical protein E4U57_007350 [Claviceps arundinis]|uniref:Tyrosine-protein phosphatase non-receptor type 6 n=1 Tax=Claviceps arundinis TaxID=1623583 RepID=A0A9P7N209_9HYPO|nr:hypothetical protein E4U57_007350 [Claviceps arundinis]KAG5978250.1 hypothetical protein E4U56_004593 [Claviceps arundinis]